MAAPSHRADPRRFRRGYPLYESVLPGHAPPYNWYGVAVLAAYAASFLWGALHSHRITDM